MICPHCRSEIDAQGPFCPACGNQIAGVPVEPGVAADTPPPEPPAVAAPQTWAIWSLALGIVALVLCPFTGPFAIWAGVRSNREREKSPMATVGLVLGAISLAYLLVWMLIGAAIVVPRVLGAGRQAREIALKGEIHQLRNSIGLFQAHNQCYPEGLSDLMRGPKDPPAQGVGRDGEERVPIVPADWQGPYLQTPDGNLPPDPITGAADWDYVNSGPDVGSVHSTSTGTGLDGTEYSTW